MNIRQKMLIGAGLLTLIPVVLTAALLWEGASTLADTALEERTRNQQPREGSANPGLAALDT
jgi:uncharacterized membrane protein